jgi:hypothetical protein
MRGAEAGDTAKLFFFEETWRAVARRMTAKRTT